MNLVAGVAARALIADARGNSDSSHANVRVCSLPSVPSALRFFDIYGEEHVGRRLDLVDTVGAT